MNSLEGSSADAGAPVCRLYSPEPGQLMASIGDGYLRGFMRGDALYLSDFYVPYTDRRQGFGQAMLRAMRSVAQESGAVRILGDITSRASVDAVKGAYGDDAVDVMLVGDYDPDEPNASVLAVARLDYQLMDNSEQVQ